ncbi:NAD(P)H-dependent flavin oxidoreductase YrpB, nitropropane dioxygenase family [Oribacterium sp. KHPX15]|uniref:NAD(P)H-dependent flavin oxidoreductase n=1 Tax=Oribacterium sp. KHPX15 TaxID=1855342 RepID=UPI00089489FE|nr:nitronate monooxygenase [Oribacterium sp. KHPX15]SEA36036.1 NAD(P)H-dependent flavin oxidoreductase YrpB, nitropropane dioxygenase family [Oribacterium sp. KHPX15]
MALLSIHGRELKIPLIQGGMGVGVSLEKLAGAVAKCGGIGCISTADCGYREDDFMKNPEEANLRALKKEIQKAKEISQGIGMVAINAMVATQQYAEAVKTAVESGIDAVISGAGLPLDLPEFVPEGKALIAPIVSSDRAFKVIAKSWERNYHRFPDFVVLEGPKAGGHLGFKEKELLEGTCQSVTEILRNLVEAVKPYEEAIGRKIPIFAAGGIWDKSDIEEVQDLGAAGVQMATRFIATEECDASQAYKDTLINADPKEVHIIHSPVGMPGRAVATPLIKRLESIGRIAPTHCSRCIKTCNPAQVPYCITKALIEAVKGNYEEGLFFTGSNVGKLTGMTTVPELVKELGF